MIGSITYWGAFGCKNQEPKPAPSIGEPKPALSIGEPRTKNQETRDKTRTKNQACPEYRGDKKEKREARDENGADIIENLQFTLSYF